MVFRYRGNVGRYGIFPYKEYINYSSQLFPGNLPVLVEANL